MVVGPQPFKNLRCTGCGMAFITPLHTSYTCTTIDPTITDDFKFDKPVDIGAFLYNHGPSLASSSARFGFVYYREKLGPSSILKRPSKRIRNDLRFLGSAWEKALAVLSGSWIRFYDIQGDSNLEAQHKLIGEIVLRDIQLEYMAEYKGRRCILALSRGGSSVYIQVGSPILQNWWGECLEYFVQKLRSPKHYNSCDVLNVRANRHNGISSPLSHSPHTRTFLELDGVKHLKKRLSSLHIGSHGLTSGFESMRAFNVFRDRDTNHLLAPYSAIIFSPDFLEETPDIEDSLSSSAGSSVSESPIHSDIDEESSSGYTSRRDSASSNHSNEISLKGPDLLASLQETGDNWDYLLDAFPLPPV
ncbi:hypothetical protein K493DRAFT_304569 [Basidiobolus meristosporus CBS 931.73]|uniref:PH domain-containing protein n=1 Tax=Basidiobolus meristosporus CBS 931.73 TaxID=1314790 RepID=A0A1Y1XYL1_9FUNG|nr:hypothetical protein K493DRAFT_304569 [Basidiobolus meristosporus CBS 931.73]|eukprot:ORX90840.1 hypothetical protein K493DRAFT_304569 [Basidiobolus meristosporus CBS 931.73]